jgi:hypothetical protein
VIRLFRDIVNELLSQFYATRQKLSLKGSKAPLANDTTLKDAGVEDGGELCVKDLGPQISWKTVFMIEYVRFVFCAVADPMLTACHLFCRRVPWSYILSFITSPDYFTEPKYSTVHYKSA